MLVLGDGVGVGVGVWEGAGLEFSVRAFFTTIFKSMNVIKTYRDVFISSFFARKVLALILDIVQNICHNLLFP